MREIRFRAWDKLKHSIVDVACVNWVDGYALLWKQTGSARSTYGAELDSIELMQYTGLTDKNGKEIYESDLIRTDGFSEGLSLPVVWRDGMVLVGKHGISPLINYARRCIVIGDIYSNPELLKEK